MKKNIRLAIMIIIILVIGITVYFLSRKIILNKSLENTEIYSKKINYSTNISLIINDNNAKSKIEYDIIRSGYIKKIVIDNYNNEELNNNIIKYIVNKNNDLKAYVYNGSKYVSLSNTKEDFIIDYSYLKRIITRIKSVKNETINNIKYKKYTVSVKAYNAYNFLYDKNIMSRDDINSNIDVNIYIDIKNDFVYKITYSINNLNNSDNDNNKLYYDVSITNRDINNSNKINLPF